MIRLMWVVLWVVVWAVMPGAVGADYDAGVKAFVNKDYTAAFQELEPLAKAGDAKSQYSLGWLYERGLGVEKDLVRAYAWYTLAQQGGHGKAVTRISEVETLLAPDQVAMAKEQAQAFVPGTGLAQSGGTAAPAAPPAAAPVPAAPAPAPPQPPAVTPEPAVAAAPPVAPEPVPAPAGDGLPWTIQPYDFGPAQALLNSFDPANPPMKAINCGIPAPKVDTPMPPAPRAPKAPEVPPKATPAPEIADFPQASPADLRSAMEIASAFPQQEVMKAGQLYDTPVEDKAGQKYVLVEKGGNRFTGLLLLMDGPDAPIKTIWPFVEGQPKGVRYDFKEANGAWRLDRSRTFEGWEQNGEEIVYGEQFVKEKRMYAKGKADADGCSLYWDKTGRPERKTCYKDNNRDGVSLMFKDGQLEAEEHYLGGKQHGASQYYKNGLLATYREHQNGKRHGWEREYSDAGLLKKEAEYQEDALVLQREYDPDTGLLKTERAYSKGKKHGVHREYDAQGFLKNLITYEMDKRQGLEQYFDGGWMTGQNSYVDGKPEGIRTAYVKTDANGWVLAEMEIIKNGNQEGPYMSTWNGVLNNEGFYKENKRVGQNKTHDKDRSDGVVRLSKVLTYADGEISGPFVKFGKFLAETGHYIVVEKDGTRYTEKLEGLYLKFNRDTGLLLEAFNFEKGQQQGAYARYDDKGDLAESGTYKDGRAETFKWYKNGKLVETGYMENGKLKTTKVQ